MNELMNISPIDGRYKNKTQELSPFFSEYALIKYRTTIEIKWLVYLIEKSIINIQLSKSEKQLINNIVDKFNTNDAVKVKEIENETKHDVKSIEYFLRDKFKEIGLEKLNPFIHITLTSEDVNNVSYNLMVKDALDNIYYKELESFIALLDKYCEKYKNIAMLSHTHGQNATPTSVGKELKVFSYRLKSVLKLSKTIALRSKFSGTVGNYNCHIIAYPDVDWVNTTKDFIHELNLDYNPLTTQIESHDILCLLLSNIKIINNIIKDFNSDMWLYISRNYFYEKPIDTEVGSSIMPHKVNPINHENSMANIEISNSLIDALVNNLSISRMQRDLSDSSKLRNIGVLLAHSLISIKESTKGLNKLEVNTKILSQELNDNYIVLTEAVQTVLRKNGYEDAYERLKRLSRGKNLTKDELHQFINDLPINENDKKILCDLKPCTYLGLAEKIVDDN